MNHRFQVGDWGHLRWQTQGLAAGWLKEAEVSVRLDAFDLTGTMDGILDTGEIFEFKTIRHPGFNQVMKDGEPKFDHVLQVTAYMMATGIRRSSVIYESTFSGEWKEFVVLYTDEIAEMVVESLERMASLKQAKVLPPVLLDCTKKTGTAYNQCPYRKDCLSWHRGGVTWPSRMLRIPVSA